MHPRASTLLCGIATSALFFYVCASATIANERWFFTAFCDTAEQDCSLPWTTTRVVTWILWGAAGVILAVTAVVSYRSGARRIVYAGMVAGTLTAAVAIALFRTL
jgi:hypothetical protein